MTEVGPLSAVARLKPVHDELGDDERPVCQAIQGRVLPGTRWRIVDETVAQFARRFQPRTSLPRRIRRLRLFQNPDATLAAITAGWMAAQRRCCTIDKLGYVRSSIAQKTLSIGAANGFQSIRLGKHHHGSSRRG